MNAIKIRSRKALKFLGLLISAMVIAAVSAQVYSFMYIQGTGEPTTTGLRWVEGDDAPNGTAISGGTVTALPLTTEGGNERNYTDCLRIQNLDAVSHNFWLNVTSSTGNWGNWTKFNLVLFDNYTGGTQQAVLDIKTQGASVSGLTIGASETWGVLFELVPIANPTIGQQVVFEVKLTYESVV